MPVISFINPQLAVDYFESEFINNPIETIVLLDINMPELSGWEVLDRILLLSEHVRNYITVIMLSSSIDPGDMQRAMKYSFVKDFLVKPLSLESLAVATNNLKAEMT